MASADVDAAELRRCEALLTPAELARAERIVVPGARDLQVVARALLRTTLSRHAGVAPKALMFQRSLDGKPYVAWPAGADDLRFNLSHTSGLVVVAVAIGCAVGVDVERIDVAADVKALAAAVLAPSERAALDAAPDSDRSETFLAFWTLKEAYLKARGVGLILPPDRFAFDLSDEMPQPVFAPPADQPLWSFRRLRPTGDHMLALAAATPAVEVCASWMAPAGSVKPPTVHPPDRRRAGTTPSHPAS